MSTSAELLQAVVSYTSYAWTVQGNGFSHTWKIPGRFWLWIGIVGRPVGPAPPKGQMLWLHRGSGLASGAGMSVQLCMRDSDRRSVAFLAYRLEWGTVTTSGWSHTLGVGHQKRGHRCSIRLFVYFSTVSCMGKFCCFITVTPVWFFSLSSPCMRHVFS